MFWMMTDIFSSFDPISFNSMNPFLNLFLSMNIMLIILTQYTFWANNQRISMLLTPFTMIIMSQLSRTYTSKLKGMNQTISSLFIILIMVNLFGLIPYLFSISSHLIFTLTFGLPLWLSMMLSTFTKSMKKSIAHFLPDGAPDWLNPFLVLIETTSITVRPMTLSFRLAANMSAGHIVLSLIGVYCAAAWFSSIIGFISLLMTTIGYILFEVAICIIQAYIFCLLLSLYSDDHAH